MNVALCALDNSVKLLLTFQPCLYPAEKLLIPGVHSVGGGLVGVGRAGHETTKVAHDEAMLQLHNSVLQNRVHEHLKYTEKLCLQTGF